MPKPAFELFIALPLLGERDVCPKYLMGLVINALDDIGLISPYQRGTISQCTDPFSYHTRVKIVMLEFKPLRLLGVADKLLDELLEIFHIENLQGYVYVVPSKGSEKGVVAK